MDKGSVGGLNAGSDSLNLGNVLLLAAKLGRKERVCHRPWNRFHFSDFFSLCRWDGIQICLAVISFGVLKFLVEAHPNDLGFIKIGAGVAKSVGTNIFFDHQGVE